MADNTLVRLTYEQDGFVFSPMIVGDPRERAAELANAGMENVTLTTYTMRGKRKEVASVETCRIACRLDDGSVILQWSS